jgi:hypothetical protein
MSSTGSDDTDWLVYLIHLVIGDVGWWDVSRDDEVLCTSDAPRKPGSIGLSL